MNNLSSLLNMRIFGIETSSYCNRHCALCPRTELPMNRFHGKAGNNPIKEYLDEKYVFALLQQMGEANYSGRVQLFNLNEPLYDPRIPSFVKFAYQKNLKVRLTTNGDPLKDNPSLLAEVIPYIHELSIGIYDYNIDSEGWQQKRNELIDQWSKTIKACDPRNNVEVRFSLREKFDRQARNLTYGYAINAPCQRVLDGVYVLYNGDITHCCSDGIGSTVFGNIKTESLESVLSNPKRKFILEAMEKGERWRFSSCRDCLSSIAEESHVCDPSLDRDGAILRLGLKYGLTPYPQAEMKIDWKPENYLSCGNMNTLIIPPLCDEFRIDSGCSVFQPNLKQAASLLTPFQKQKNLIAPRHKHDTDKMRSVHIALVQQIGKHYSAERSDMLLIGEGRFFRTTFYKKCLMQSIYKGVGGTYNCLHYPLTVGNIRDAKKYLHIWTSVKPDLFVYCMGIHEGKIAEGSDKPKVDLDTFSFLLKSLIKEIREQGTERVIVVTPMPLKNPQKMEMKWSLNNDAIKRYSDAAITAADETGAEVIDVFSLCMKTQKQQITKGYGKLMNQAVVKGICNKS